MRQTSFQKGRIGLSRRPFHPALPAGQTGWRAVVLALSVLTASVAGADPDIGAQKQRLVAAIKAAGCIVHEGNHADILIAAKLTPEEGRIIVTEMMARGEAEPLDDDLRLTTGGCP